MKAQFIYENIVSFEKPETEKDYKHSLFPLNKDLIVEYVEKLMNNHPLDFSNLTKLGRLYWSYNTWMEPPATYYELPHVEEKDNDSLHINFAIKEDGSDLELEWIFPNGEHSMHGAKYRKKRVNSIEELDKAINSLPDYIESNELWEVV